MSRYRYYVLTCFEPKLRGGFDTWIEALDVCQKLVAAGANLSVALECISTWNYVAWFKQHPGNPEKHLRQYTPDMDILPSFNEEYWVETSEAAHEIYRTRLCAGFR